MCTSISEAEQVICLKHSFVGGVAGLVSQHDQPGRPSLLHLLAHTHKHHESTSNNDKATKQRRKQTKNKTHTHARNSQLTGKGFL